MGIKTVQGDDEYNVFSPLLGFEVYPGSNVSLHYQYSGGYINDSYLSEHRAMVNYHYKRYFGQIGYQNFKANDSGIPGILLGVGVHY